MYFKHGSKERTSVTEIRIGTNDILCISLRIFELHKIWEISWYKGNVTFSRMTGQDRVR